MFVCLLILLAYQPVWGYVMPNGYEVIHIVYLYLYFLVIGFNNVLALLGIMLYDIDLFHVYIVRYNFISLKNERISSMLTFSNRSFILFALK